MLKGKTAIITGASRGIGAAVAYKLASMGADLALIYARNEAAAAEIRRRCAEDFGVRAEIYCCDVADFSAAKACAKAIKSDFGGADLLVNNAGVTRDGLLAMMSEEAWDSVLDTNLKGAFNMLRHCAAMLLRSDSGCVINISSVSGLMGNVGQANYSASKAGLIGLTKSAAKELAAKGVRCNAVAPGFIETDMTAALSAQSEELIKQIPLARRGRPEDVAEAVAYLAVADYVTGTVLTVDGGLSM